MVKDLYKMDANESAFFAKQLEYVKSQTYDEKMAPLDFMRFIPVSSEAPLGATNITWRSYTSYGMAKFIADYAKDFPRVDLGGKEESVKLHELGASYGWSITEIRRAQMAGVALETRKARAVRRAFEQKMDSIAWNGDADRNLPGFIKYTGSTEYTVPNPGSGTEWVNKTADQILTDLNGIKNAVYIGTNGVEQINTILMPLEQFDLIKNTRVGTNSDTTIYEFFTRNNPGIMVEGTRYMKGAGTAGADVIQGYARDADHLEFHVPMMFEQFEAEKEGMEYKIPCHAIVGPVVAYYPAAIAWGEGI